jgi:hypothetical protein
MAFKLNSVKNPVDAGRIAVDYSKYSSIEEYLKEMNPVYYREYERISSGFESEEEVVRSPLLDAWLRDLLEAEKHLPMEENPEENAEGFYSHVFAVCMLSALEKVRTNLPQKIQKIVLRVNKAERFQYFYQFYQFYQFYSDALTGAGEIGLKYHGVFAPILAMLEKRDV